MINRIITFVDQIYSFIGSNSGMASVGVIGAGIGIGTIIYYWGGGVIEYKHYSQNPGEYMRCLEYVNECKGNLPYIVFRPKSELISRNPWNNKLDFPNFASRAYDDICSSGILEMDAQVYHKLFLFWANSGSSYSLTRFIMTYNGFDLSFWFAIL